MPARKRPNDANQVCQRRRPSRPLNLQNSPNSNKAITASNSESSPLLRLPEELRKQIYGYVLGGRTIHIRATVARDVFEVRVCKSSEDYDVDQTTCKFLQRDIPNVDHHAECREPLGLALLHTSRQVYSEVRWEPFASNRFAVSCDRVPKIHNPGAYNDLLQSDRRDREPIYLDCGTLLSVFLKNHLMPSQIRTIANLIIEEAFCFYSMHPATKGFSSVQGLNRLESLDIRINGLLERPHDLWLLCEKFTQDSRLSSLLRQQERCRSVRVSLELYTTTELVFPPASLPSAQSLIKDYASMWVRQAPDETDELIAQQEKKYAQHRSANRQQRNLRPL